MLEPLSLLSTAIGLLGFVLNTLPSTIESITERKHLYEKCVRRLKFYEKRLEDQKDSIEKWELIWFQTIEEPFDDATYDYLWGSEGNRKIADMLENIDDQFEAIVKIFRFRHGDAAHFDWANPDLPPEFHTPPGTEVRRWNGLLDRASQSRQPHIFQGDPNASILWRFGFAMYKNKNIESRLNELDTMIKEMQLASARYFSQRLDTTDVPLNNDDVRRARDLHSERHKFLTFFKHLRKRHDDQLDNDEAYGWELVFADLESESPMLVIPSPDCHFHKSTLASSVNALVEIANLTCTVYAQKNADNEHQLHAHLFNVNYPGDHPQVGELDPLHAQILNWNTDTTQIVNAASCRAFLEDNDRWTQLRNSLRLGTEPRTIRAVDNWRQVLEYYRLILTASAIARAVVFFYGTEWVRDLCSCEIMRARLSSPTTSGLITRIPLAPSPPDGPWDDCQHLPQTNLRYKTFLLLGVFLMEMAFVAPIEIRPTGVPREAGTLDGDVEFILPLDVLPRGVHNPVTVSKMLVYFHQMKPRGGAAHVGMNYRAAVEECFNMRNRFVWQRHGRFTAGGLDRCIKRIVEP